MSQASALLQTLRLELPYDLTLQVTQAQFEDIALANRDLRLERTAEGELINPQARQVEVYRSDQQKEVLENPQTLSGEEVLPGFVLDLERVWL